MKGVYSIRVRFGTTMPDTMIFTNEIDDLNNFSRNTGAPVTVVNSWYQVQHGDITVCCSVDATLSRKYRTSAKANIAAIKDVLSILEAANLKAISADYEDRLEWSGILVDYKNVRDFIRWAIRHGGERMELTYSECAWKTIHLTYLVRGVKVSIVHHI